MQPFATVVRTAVKGHPVVCLDGLPLGAPGRDLLKHLEEALAPHLVDEALELCAVARPV